MATRYWVIKMLDAGILKKESEESTLEEANAWAKRLNDMDKYGERYFVVEYKEATHTKWNLLKLMEKKSTKLL